MKLKNFVLAVVCVFVLPVAAHASCIGSSCNQLTDGDFSSAGLYWVESGNVTYGNISVCNSSSARVRIDPGQSISQTLTSSNFGDYELMFDGWIVNDTDNFYDQLTITVRNNTTGVSEVFYRRGTTWTNCSSTFEENLANDYDGASVTVTFEVSSLASSGWYIDNAAFWGLN